MKPERRGTSFFALVYRSDGPLAEAAPALERVLLAAENALRGRGPLERVLGPGLAAVMTGATETEGAPRDPRLETLRLCAGVGTAEVSLSVSAGGAVLRADALGRRTLHGALLRGGDLLVGTTVAPVIAALRALGEEVVIDPLSMRRFFTYSFIPAPFSAFRGVFTVPPAHETTVTHGSGLGPFTRFYDVPATRGATWLPDDDAADGLTAALSEALRDPLGARVGVLLSGGLDSALVASAARHIEGLVALTIDLEEDSEADAAAEIARALGLPHQRAHIGTEGAVSALRKAAAALDTPIGDPVVAPFVHLASETDRTVLLNGEGGDQLFAGWATKPMLAWARYATEDDDIAEAYAQTFHKLHDVRHDALGPALRPLAFHPADDLRPFLSDDRAERHDGFFHLLCDANLWLKGAGNLLPRIDRCLGSQGVEAYSPLLDPRFVAAAFRVASTQKQRGTTEKWILRHALRGVLPAPCLDLPKRGMKVPVSRWLGGELGVFARDILTSSRFRHLGWLDARFVEQLLAGEVRSPDLRRRRPDEWIWLALFAAVWEEHWAG